MHWVYVGHPKRARQILLRFYFQLSDLAELGRSNPGIVELRLGRAPVRLALPLQAGHPGESMLRAVKPLPVSLEPIARQLIAPGLKAHPPLHHAHALRAVRPAEHRRLVVVPTARARAAPRELARLRRHVHTRFRLVVLAEPSHAVSRVPEVGLFSAPQRLAPLDVNVFHPEHLVGAAHPRLLLPGPAPQRLPSTGILLASTLGHIRHQAFLVEHAEARPFPLEREAGAHLCSAVGTKRGRVG